MASALPKGQDMPQDLPASPNEDMKWMDPCLVYCCICGADPITEAVHLCGVLDLPPHQHDGRCMNVCADCVNGMAALLPPHRRLS